MPKNISNWSGNCESVICSECPIHTLCSAFHEFRYEYDKLNKNTKTSIKYNYEKMEELVKNLVLAYKENKQQIKDEGE